MPVFVLAPPFPTVPKRDMHRALLVPEILSIIFKHVTDDAGKPFLSTLAAIARTCRSFQCQVEEILWYKLHDISALYNILPPRVRSKASQSWSLSRRMFSGSDWTRFMDRARRVRILSESASPIAIYPHYEWSWAVFPAIASLRDPPLLTPNLQKLKWRSNHPSCSPAINLFLGPSLRSLEIDAKLLAKHVIHPPLGKVCPKLEHLKVIGNGRSAVDAISSVLCGLHCLKTVACSTLNNSAFIHLAQLKTLSCMAVDMRWSELYLDALRDRFLLDSFQNLQMLSWKDYNLELLTDIFLVPNISPPTVHLEIESFCTSSSLHAFLHSFAEKFPRTRDFSLVHDIEASRRFGLRAGAPGREHGLGACDLEPLFALKSLRVLNLADLGNLHLDDDLVKTIASALPELEQLHLGTDAAGPAPTSVTFDGLLSLLQHCPKLQSVGLCVDAEDMLSFWDTTVRHNHVTHIRLEGCILGSRQADVDKMLRRVMPNLKTVEESLDRVTRHVRDVVAPGKNETSRTSAEGGPATGRRTRKSQESVRGG